MADTEKSTWDYVTSIFGTVGDVSKTFITSAFAKENASTTIKPTGTDTATTSVITPKNILITVGGCLGLFLAYKVVKKIVK